jgi:hypothetical protein
MQAVKGETAMDDQRSNTDALAPSPSVPVDEKRRKRSIVDQLKQNFWVRRRYLVNSKRQLRAALLVSLVVVIPLVALNVGLHFGAVTQTRTMFAGLPDAATQRIAELDRTEMILVMIGSLVYLGGVFFMTILETHQTSGAAVGIIRHFRNIRDGRYDAKLHLRDSDNLQELVEPFNQMTSALTQRAIQTSALLNDLATDAEALEGGESLSRELRELAVNQAHLAGKSR